MKVSNLILLAVASAVLVACGGSNSDDCTSNMDSTRTKYGSPEDTRSYVSSVSTYDVWDYPSKGLTFYFYKHDEGYCEVKYATYRPY